MNLGQNNIKTHYFTYPVTSLHDLIFATEFN